MYGGPERLCADAAADKSDPSRPLHAVAEMNKHKIQDPAHTWTSTNRSILSQDDYQRSPGMQNSGDNLRAGDGHTARLVSRVAPLRPSFLSSLGRQQETLRNTTVGSWCEKRAIRNFLRRPARHEAVLPLASSQQVARVGHPCILRRGHLPQHSRTRACARTS